MIVCHCNIICCHDIRESVAEMRARDPHCIVTPGGVFKSRGGKAVCAGCMPLFTDILEQAVQEHGGRRRRARTVVLDCGHVSGLVLTEEPATTSCASPANQDAKAGAGHAHEGEGYERQQGRR